MFLILILVLSFSGCKSSKVIEDNSSTNSISEYSEMLINTNLLSSVSIHNVYDQELVKIPVKEDWAFLGEYIKTGSLPMGNKGTVLLSLIANKIYLRT